MNDRISYLSEAEIPLVRAKLQNKIRKALKEFAEIDPHVEIKIDLTYPGKFNYDVIISWWCYYFRITIEDINSKHRKRVKVDARHGAMHMLKKNSRQTVKQIAYKFGKRDHSTVVHAVKKVDDLMETDFEFRETYNQIKKHIDNEVDILEFIKKTR